MVWMLLIFIVSDQPSLPQLIPAPGQDIVTTIAHVLEYGIFAVLLHRAMFPEQAPSRAGVVAIWIICLIYAISDESHQSAVPGRDPSPVDVIADVTGAAAALAVMAQRRSVS